jgi:hypothetical protein
MVQTSAEQPSFADPGYISNCDAKRSVCSTYPSAACDPVRLRLLSEAAFADISACLGMECGGPAESCVLAVLSCGTTEP